MEHAAGVPAWAAALEASLLGVAMRESAFLYPLANLLHLLGLVLLVGAMLLLDLRLLGVGRRAIAADAAARLLTPLAIAGVVLQIVTGLCLFAADAGPLVGSGAFVAKLILIAVGLGNALLFRLAWQRRLADWDARPPAPGLAQAAISVAVWLAVGTLGRLIAYF